MNVAGFQTIEDENLFIFITFTIFCVAVEQLETAAVGGVGRSSSPRSVCRLLYRFCACALAVHLRLLLLLPRLLPRPSMST